MGYSGDVRLVQDPHSGYGLGAARLPLLGQLLVQPRKWGHIVNLLASCSCLWSRSQAWEPLGSHEAMWRREVALS